MNRRRQLFPHIGMDITEYMYRNYGEAKAILEYHFTFYESNILKFTLSWDDPGKDNFNLNQGTFPNNNNDLVVLSVRTLVNDLDLEVYDPVGSKYFPWTFPESVPDQIDPKIPATTGVNTRDNIEQVRIIMPPPAMQLIPGNWTIKVRAPRSFGVNPQSYSLVASYNNYQAYETPCPVGTGHIEFPDLKKFAIKDASGNIVAWIDNKGNFVLKGRLFTKDPITSSAGEKEFIIKRASDQKIVALLKTSTGDLYITNKIFEHQTDNDFNRIFQKFPNWNYFFIKDSDGKILAFIDSGDDPDFSGLHLRGGIFEHSQP